MFTEKAQRRHSQTHTHTLTPTCVRWSFKTTPQVESKIQPCTLPRRHVHRNSLLVRVGGQEVVSVKPTHLLSPLQQKVALHPGAISTRCPLSGGRCRVELRSGFAPAS